MNAKVPVVLFQLGQVVATPNAIVVVSGEEMLAALGRHQAGDWGDLCEDDKRENDFSLQKGFRLLSAYHARDGTKFWIITESDRSVTTLLLPEDY